MSVLKVENKVLKYKGITYQISQISSIKIVEIRKINRKNVSLEPLKQLVPAFIFLVWVSFSLLQNGIYYGLLACVGAIVILSLIFRILKRKLTELSKQKYLLLSGLSMRMSNGDDPLFISNDKNLLFKVKDALYDSMNNNQVNTSISFDNVNIEVTDSEKVEIGNIIGG